MRLLPKDQDWTAYAWLVYLLFFLLAGWTSHLPATAAATAAGLVLYLWSYWVRGARVLWIVAAWFALGVMFLRENPAASVFFVYAACLYGKVWEPPVAFRFLAGHLVLLSLLCWAVGCNVYVWISSVVFSAHGGSGRRAVCATQAVERPPGGGSRAIGAPCQGGRTRAHRA